MQRSIILAAFIIPPMAASAQNMSTSFQFGHGNVQSTVQSGENAAMTMQVGSDNTASITQQGEHNVAGVGQVGEGHSRTVEQIGDNLGYGSIQTSSEIYTDAFSGIGGNAYTSTTLDIEATD